MEIDPWQRSRAAAGSCNRNHETCRMNQVRSISAFLDFLIGFHISELDGADQVFEKTCLFDGTRPMLDLRNGANRDDHVGSPLLFSLGVRRCTTLNTMAFRERSYHCLKAREEFGTLQTAQIATTDEQEGSQSK
jgi:hypothetical protein